MADYFHTGTYIGSTLIKMIGYSYQFMDEEHVKGFDTISNLIVDSSDFKSQIMKIAANFVNYCKLSL